MEGGAAGPACGGRCPAAAGGAPSCPRPLARLPLRRTSSTLDAMGELQEPWEGRRAVRGWPGARSVLQEEVGALLQRVELALEVAISWRLEVQEALEAGGGNMALASKEPAPRCQSGSSECMGLQEPHTPSRRFNSATMPMRGRPSGCGTAHRAAAPRYRLATDAPPAATQRRCCLRSLLPRLPRTGAAAVAPVGAPVPLPLSGARPACSSGASAACFTLLAGPLMLAGAARFRFCRDNTVLEGEWKVLIW